MINDTLFFMLIVGIIISAGLLLLFVWAAKTGQFDDANKMLNNPLYDSIEDFQSDYGEEYESMDDIERSTMVIPIDDERFIIEISQNKRRNLK